jgi:orotate phosphoribosyltransferase
MVVQIHQYCNSIQSDTDAIVGVVSGGISWASGIANCDLIPVLRAHARPKDHGLHNQIDGELEKDGDKVIVVDDVLTSGSSVLSVVNALRKGKSNKKAEILAVYTILDWNLASTNKKFEEAGVKKVCLLTMEEVLDYGFEHSLIPIEYKPAIQSFMKEHL